MMKHLGLWVAGVVCAAGLACADEAALVELGKIRDTLRTRLEERMKAAATDGAAREYALTLSPAFSKQPLKFALLRQANGWLAHSVGGLPESWTLRGVDVAGLKLEGTSLRGPVKFTWSASDPEEGEAGTRSQTFHLDVQSTASARRLVVTLHNFLAGQDWVVAFAPVEGGWAYDGTLAAPKEFVDWGPFEIKVPGIKPDPDGKFSLTIEMVHVGRDRILVDAYAGTVPKVTISGRLVEERIETTWMRAAVGGKHLLGSGQDAVTGAMLDSTLAGTFLSKGDRGEWKGDATGTVRAASRSAGVIATVESADATPPVRAAQLYRQIVALEIALRNLPMPVQEALNRARVPMPATTAAAAGAAYVAGVLTHARQVLNPPATAALAGFQAPEDDEFGPFYSQPPLADAKLPAATSDGPQQWRAIVGWEMNGPFSVLDQETELSRPELVAAPGVAYRRTRMFTVGRGGEVEVADDASAWVKAAFDGGMVYAPATKEASSGSERYFAWYAATELESPVAQTIWLAAQVAGQGMLWINDELVWSSGADFASLRPAVLQVKLRAGPNRLLFRCGSNRTSNEHFGHVDWFEGYEPRLGGRIDATSFALHICTQGQPGKPAASRAADTPLRNNHASPNPPLAWDQNENINIAWQAKLPRGKAEPVIHVGKVFVTAEPNLLICLDAATGKELWRKEVAGNAKLSAKPGHLATLAPLVQDDRVFVSFGTGIVACFGLDGAERWRVPTEPWNHPNPGVMLLVDGKLIVPEIAGKAGQFSAFALEADTGKKLWSVTAPAKRVITRFDYAAGLGHGFALMRLVNGAHSKALLITGDGVVLDAATGALLHRDIFTKEANRATPYIVGNIVLNTPVMGEEAVKLWLDDHGRVGARTLWANDPAYGRGQCKTVTDWGSYHWMKEPVVAEDRVFVWRVDKAHVPQHVPTPWGQLEIFDLKTGARIARQRGLTTDATDPTLAPVIAGKYLYVGDGGDPVGGFGGTTQFGQLNVLELLPGADTVPVFNAAHQGVWGIAGMAARNRTDRYRANPVFAGDRLYLRTYNGVVCVAVTTPAGQRYQDEVLAKTTLAELIGPPPKQLSTVAFTALTDFVPAAGHAVSRLLPRQMPKQWLMLGPLAPGTPPPTGVPTANDADGKWQCLPETAFTDAGEIDALAAADRKSGTESYFFTVLDSTRRQTMTLACPNDKLTVWVAGKELKSGDHLQFEIGHYPVLIRHRLDPVPPFIKSVPASFSFTASETVADTIESWRARVRILRPRLEAIIKSLPNTAEAATAQAYLKEASSP